MGKDLGSMIEEINNASSTLSKTNKTDEPVSFLLSYDRELKVTDSIDLSNRPDPQLTPLATPNDRSRHSRTPGQGQRSAKVGAVIGLATGWLRT